MPWLCDAKSIELLSSYESRLRKAAEKTQAEIECLQSARKEAHAKPQEQAIRLAKFAVHEGISHTTANPISNPLSIMDSWVFNYRELARAADRQDRLRRSCKTQSSPQSCLNLTKTGSPSPNELMLEPECRLVFPIPVAPTPSSVTSF